MLRLAVAVALLAARAAAGRSFYDVLRVGEDASERQIKRAFRKLSLKFHPDKCREDDCQERFMEVNRGECTGTVLCAPCRVAGVARR